MSKPMTQGEIQLLIQDICARSHFGLICSIYREDDEGFGWRDAECKGYFQNNGSYEFYFDDVITVDNIERLKHYLRPMLSMTGEEMFEIEMMNNHSIQHIDTVGVRFKAFYDIAYNEMYDLIDWLNAHYFDYRRLIEKGLALEAPEDMYNTKTE